MPYQLTHELGLVACCGKMKRRKAEGVCAMDRLLLVVGLLGAAVHANARLRPRSNHSRTPVVVAIAANALAVSALFSRRREVGALAGVDCPERYS